LLDDFVGEWDVTGAITMQGLDQPLRLSGKTEVFRCGDGWSMAGRGTIIVQGQPESLGLAIWTYDHRTGEFRTVSINSHASRATGTAWYDRNEGVWFADAVDSSASVETRWQGRIEFLDRDTKQEEWTGRPAGSPDATIVLTKTERRRTP
jgi:hypothetical protein